MYADMQSSFRRYDPRDKRRDRRTEPLRFDEQQGQGQMQPQPLNSALGAQPAPAQLPLAQQLGGQAIPYEQSVASINQAIAAVAQPGVTTPAPTAGAAPGPVPVDDPATETINEALVSRYSDVPLGNVFDQGDTRYSYSGPGAPRRPAATPTGRGSVGGFLIPGTGPGIPGQEWNLDPMRGWGNWPAGGGGSYFTPGPGGSNIYNPGSGPATPPVTPPTTPLTTPPTTPPSGTPPASGPFDIHNPNATPPPPTVEGYQWVWNANINSWIQQPTGGTGSAAEANKYVYWNAQTNTWQNAPTYPGQPPGVAGGPRGPR